MSKTDRDGLTWWPWVLGILGVLATNGLVLAQFFDKWEERGTFGDMFGAANALFSGLAFVGVIWAILLQKRELSLQREELEQTRMELRGQKEQLEAQNATAQRQAFDSAFFSMLRLHNEVAESVTTRQNHGRMALAKHNGDLVRRLQEKSETDVLGINEIRVEIDQYFQSIPGDLAHYLRNFTALLSIVDKAPTDDLKYGSIAAAQMSD